MVDRLSVGDNRIAAVPVDLSSLQSVRTAARQLFRQDEHIAALIHIAAIFTTKYQKGPQGLEMMLTIGRGRGYVAADGNKGPETTIGMIPVDSIFSPVRRVSVHVDSARVGQRTDYDKLTLDIYTDGSVTPREAVEQAAEVLIRQLAIFTNIDTSDLTSLAAASPVGALEPEMPEAHGMENILIEELELGVRSYNCLKRVGIETIGDLVTKSENELAAIPNFGKKSIEEVKETLAQHGLGLRGSNGAEG